MPRTWRNRTPGEKGVTLRSYVLKNAPVSDLSCLRADTHRQGDELGPNSNICSAWQKQYGRVKEDSSQIPRHPRVTDDQKQATLDRLFTGRFPCYT